MTRRPPPPERDAQPYRPGARVEFDNDRWGEPATLRGVVDSTLHDGVIIRLDEFKRFERDDSRTIRGALQFVAFDRLRNPTPAPRWGRTPVR